RQSRHTGAPRAPQPAQRSGSSTFPRSFNAARSTPPTLTMGGDNSLAQGESAPEPRTFVAASRIFPEMSIASDASSAVTVGVVASGYSELFRRRRSREYAVNPRI